MAMEKDAIYNMMQTKLRNDLMLTEMQLPRT